MQYMLSITILLLTLANSFQVLADDKGKYVNKVALNQAANSRAGTNATQNKSYVRGGIVYRTYCILCHGESGDGNARGTLLYGKISLVINMTDEKRIEKIVREGGESLGRSPYMPVWKDELSNEQIKDVVTYTAQIANTAKRGEAVYMKNCILCHGPKANGKGRAAVLYDPPPSNLRRSDKNDDYKRMIISNGGASMGRSEVMPMWGDQLSSQEIEDVVKYLRTIVE